MRGLNQVISGAVCRLSGVVHGVPITGADGRFLSGSFPAPPKAGNSSREFGLLRGVAKGVK